MNNFYFLIIITILADKCSRFRIYKCNFFLQIVLELFLLFLVRLILLICVQIGVVFTTLLERKILGYVHIRKWADNENIFP